jgi:hypothetical protein
VVSARLSPWLSSVGAGWSTGQAVAGRWGNFQFGARGRDGPSMRGHNVGL